MNAPLRTYRPPAADTQNYRSSATTRVAPFAHLHICSFANSTYNSSPITHNSSHSFSAKERDPETGLSYFGSRYYSADLSVWLSVDPQSGKYPYQSNYVYCSDNPLKVIDPNGEDEWEVTDWVLTSDGKVYWDENATSQETTKPGERYLGKAGQFVSTEVGICVMNLYNDGTMREQKAVVIRPQKSSATSGNSRIAEQFGNIENKVTQKGLAFGEGLATALPISSTVNDVHILLKGEDIFGNIASQSDRNWAMASALTFGGGKIVKCLRNPTLKGVEKCLDGIGVFLNLRSGYKTSKNANSNEDDKRK